MKGNLWTKEEENYLLKNWGVVGKNEIMSYFKNKTYNAVCGKALRLGLCKSKPQKTWSLSDITYIENNYINVSCLDMAKHLNRTKESVKSYTNKILKLKLKSAHKNNLKCLLEDTNENWYWLGFIAADGYINSGYLNITLHKKDEVHLLRLAEKLNAKIYYTNKDYVKISISDAINIEKLKIKIGQDRNLAKTYTPLNIAYNISKESYLSFIIGFIDGDGCIEVKNNKMRCLKIECHSSWYNNLIEIGSFLKNFYNIPSKVSITNRGYALFRITSHKNGVLLRSLMQSLNIPYLERKWLAFGDSMDRTWFFRDIEEEVVSMYKKGFSLYKIANTLGLPPSAIYNHKRKITVAS